MPVVIVAVKRSFQSNPRPTIDCYDIPMRRRSEKFEAGWCSTTCQISSWGWILWNFKHVFFWHPKIGPKYRQCITNDNSVAFARHRNSWPHPLDWSQYLPPRVLESELKEFGSKNLKIKTSIKYDEVLFEKECAHTDSVNYFSGIITDLSCSTDGFQQSFNLEPVGGGCLEPCQQKLYLQLGDDHKFQPQSVGLFGG